MIQVPKRAYKSTLDERTLEFAKQIIRICKELPRDVVTIELVKQLIRSGTSVGANYREANDALSRKDFIYRLRITRKEGKETLYWLECIIEAHPHLTLSIEPHKQECRELIKIFSSIIQKSG